MSKREEDTLFQEFDHRIAYRKFQIASFIKDRISIRRRPIDGWKYMIEVLGPNAKKGRGNVSRIPSISDPSSAPDSAELSFLCSWPLYACLVIKLHAVMFS
ncbi:hypothetical protein NC651_028023 [Populus alba x Populus x berolinensis]|nr:hypothetical protein NC651_028023 [Populus alba x Populus x berolinensis]